MTEVPDLDGLARRYLDLWEEQAIAWAGDATLADSIRLWLGLAGAARTGTGAEGEGDVGDGRGDDIGGRRQPTPRAAARAAPAAGASGGGDDDMARVARRLAALEQRVARL